MNLHVSLSMQTARQRRLGSVTNKPHRLIGYIVR